MKLYKTNTYNYIFLYKSTDIFNKILLCELHEKTFLSITSQYFF